MNAPLIGTSVEHLVGGKLSRSRIGNNQRRSIGETSGAASSGVTVPTVVDEGSAADEVSADSSGQTNL